MIAVSESATGACQAARSKTRGVVGVLLFVAGLLVLPSPSASAQPESAVKEELWKLYRELNEARAQRDRAAVERFYSPHFIWAHAAGWVETLPEFLDSLFTLETIGPIPMPKFEPPEQFVLLADGNGAIARRLGSTPVAGRALSTTVYEKVNGRWRIAEVHAVALLPERTAVKVDGEVLDRYVGDYPRGGGVVTVIERRGDGLAMRHPGVPVRVLVPVSDTRFFDKVGTEYEFTRSPAGEVNFMFRMTNGRTGTAVKSK